MRRIGIVAGEASGDLLGADLIRTLRELAGDTVFEGIGGPLMEQAGCRIMAPMEKLSVMGLMEVAGSYLGLARLRHRLLSHFIENPPELFIGVDAPDFNLPIEERLHACGVRTVHYVSPSVWAWREYRLRKIRRAVDLMLVLFPFEEAYYSRCGQPAVYTGHPLATRIASRPDMAAARARLGLPAQCRITAVMPGSRRMELTRLLKPFLQAADLCAREWGDMHFVTSLLDEQAVDLFRTTQHSLALEHLPVSVYIGASHDVLEAADVALLASGTITLEAMLYKKPMVVAYKLHPVTYPLLRAMVRVPYAALPNLLAGTRIVPECLQADCTPDHLAAEIRRWYEQPEACDALVKAFTAMHEGLRPPRVAAAAHAVLELLAGS